MAPPDNPIRLLVVHPSADLYGSDRSLLDFVRHHGLNMEVTVALPEHGILVQELQKAGATVIVGEVCKIERRMVSLRGVLKTVLATWNAMRFLGSTHRQARFNLVYTNTTAVLGGALFAKLWGVPHVWHVREILAYSDPLTFIFRQLVGRLSKAVICNSGATRNWIRPKGHSKKYQVIWNGFDLPRVEVDRQSERARMGASETDVLFVLVGRINSWKGQKLLVEAFATLVREWGVEARLAIVGSAAAGQEFFERELETFVANSGCAERVMLIPFRADIAPVWIASDIVVVPSIEPEPFGRVAIEAMGFARPVIAAAHGGLAEIVVDGETGLLFPPGNVQALTAAMGSMLRDTSLRQRMGEAGRARQQSLFTLPDYVSRLAEIIERSAARNDRLLKKAVAEGSKTNAKTRKQNILFVHQSAEMYGSDKVLLLMARGIEESGSFHAIVVLPEYGQLHDALMASGIEVHLADVAKISRAVISPLELILLFRSTIRGFRALSRVVAGRDISLVHSNTLAVLSGALWSKWHRVPHLWHVHEIILSPLLAKKAFPMLVRLFSDRVMSNSTQTEQWLLHEQPRLKRRSVIVFNGVPASKIADATAIAAFRARVSASDHELVVTLAGRINLWKGHALLIDAASELGRRGRLADLRFVFLGDPAPGLESLLPELQARVVARGLTEQFTFLPFLPDIAPAWCGTDIAVVPSTDPEPFGLVAIEAMAVGVPVVAAAHGGLLDIIEDGVSGLLFKPRDSNALADAINQLALSPELRKQLGSAGRERQRNLFSEQTQIDRTTCVYREMLART